MNINDPIPKNIFQKHVEHNIYLYVHIVYLNHSETMKIQSLHQYDDILVM